MRTRLSLLCFLLVVGHFAVQSHADDDVFAINRRLGRGMNLGNCLDAPAEGAWGVTLEESYFQLIADAGFNSIRLPVRWSAHAQHQQPYTIDPTFMSRVQWGVDQALKRNLVVVLNFHHIKEMMEKPNENIGSFTAMWQQVAEHFKDYPDTLIFEILNEPQSNLDIKTWNAMFPKVLAVIRKSNPTRAVVVGPAQWNSVRALRMLELPDDKNLIVTVHDYEPYHFTHQGAEWVGAQSQQWLGTTWTGTPEQKKAVDKDLDIASEFSKQHHVPIYLGEFGTYVKADMNSRAAWTRYVRQQAEKRGFSWAYWEFCSLFGAYDAQDKQWRRPLIDALTKDQ